MFFRAIRIAERVRAPHRPVAHLLAAIAEPDPGRVEQQRRPQQRLLAARSQSRPIAVISAAQLRVIRFN